MTSFRKLKIAVIDRGFVSPYFDEFFTILNQAPDREYVVFHGDPPSWVGLRAAPVPYAFPSRRIENVELLRTMIYQRLVREVAYGGYDIVIIGHELKFVSNWLILTLCKARGIPVIIWGYGYHAPRGIGYRAKSSRAWSGIASTAKDWIAHMADGYLAYTDRGAARMRSLNLPYEVFAVHQSVNVHVQVALHERLRNQDRPSLRRRLGLRPDSIAFLYVGRLVEAKNVAHMVKVVARLNDTVATAQPIEARIIGGGQCLQALREQARAVDGVEVLGEIYDQEQLAPYFAASDALMLPGAAGITVTHAFAYGLPVIMAHSQLHSPEADYVIDGYNGLIAADEHALVEVAGRFVDHPALRRELAAGALATRDRFSMTQMAEEFHNAVDEVLRSRRRLRGGLGSHASAWARLRAKPEQSRGRTSDGRS